VEASPWHLRRKANEPHVLSDPSVHAFLAEFRQGQYPNQLVKLILLGSVQSAAPAGEGSLYCRLALLLT
jgi:hypothetical protein